MGKRISKKRIREVLYESGGNISEVARRLNLSRTTIYKYIESYELEDQIQLAKDSIVGESEMIVYNRLRKVLKDSNGNPLVDDKGNERPDEDAQYDAATWILERQGKTRGWSKNYNVHFDGSVLNLSPDVIEKLAALGISSEMALQEFEDMIRQLANEDSA